MINEKLLSIGKKGDFTEKVPLQEGENAVSIMATDIHGNSSNLSIQVIKKAPKQQDSAVAAADKKKSLEKIKSVQPAPKNVNLADSEGPKIVIYEPAARRGLNVSEPERFETLKVRGTVYDESGLKEITINEKTISFDKNGNFTENIPLKQGINTIAICAVDIYGNMTNISIKAKKKESTKLVAKQQPLVNVNPTSPVWMQ